MLAILVFDCICGEVLHVHVSRETMARALGWSDAAINAHHTVDGFEQALRLVKHTQRMTERSGYPLIDGQDVQGAECSVCGRRISLDLLFGAMSR